MSLIFNNYIIIRNWLSNFTIISSLSILKFYSNISMIVGNKISKLYYTNEIAKKTIDSVNSIFHNIFQFVLRKKVEPFYNPWCSISYFKEGLFSEIYMNLNDDKLELPFITTTVLNTKFTDFNSEELVKNKLNYTINNFIETCNFVKHISLEKKYNFLIIIKMKHRYISRITESSTIVFQDISFEQTPKFFLCVEYTHPEMKNSIYLEVDSGYFLKRNEILSMSFVKRLLEHQSQKYIFDEKYKVKILNWHLVNIEIGSNDYILLDENSYKIKSNEKNMNNLSTNNCCL